MLNIGQYIRSVCQKFVSRAGTSNYIPYYLWDVITCHYPWYLLLAQHSSFVNLCRSIIKCSASIPHNSLFTFWKLGKIYAKSRCDIFYEKVNSVSADSVVLTDGRSLANMCVYIFFFFFMCVYIDMTRGSVLWDRFIIVMPYTGKAISPLYGPFY